MATSNSITVDYARHLLRRNGCRARVSIVDVKEIGNDNAQEQQTDNTVQFPAQNQEPYRMAASEEVRAALIARGMQVD